MTTNIAMAIFTLLGIGGGIALLRWTDPIYRVFKTGMDMMTIYPKRLRDATTKPGGIRVAGMGFIVFGTMAFAILLWRLANGYGFA